MDVDGRIGGCRVILPSMPPVYIPRGTTFPVPCRLCILAWPEIISRHTGREAVEVVVGFLGAHEEPVVGWNTKRVGVTGIVRHSGLDPIGVASEFP